MFLSMDHFNEISNRFWQGAITWSHLWSLAMLGNIFIKDFWHFLPLIIWILCITQARVPVSCHYTETNAFPNPCTQRWYLKSLGLKKSLPDVSNFWHAMYFFKAAMAFCKFYELPFSFSWTTMLCLNNALPVSQLLRTSRQPTRPAVPTFAIAWNLLKQELSTNRQVVEEILDAQSLM